MNKHLKLLSGKFKCSETKGKMELSILRKSKLYKIENVIAVYHLVQQKTIFRIKIPSRLEQETWGLEDLVSMKKRGVQFRKLQNKDNWNF